LTESKNEHVIEQVNEPLYIYNKKQTEITTKFVTNLLKPLF
jgi:hypothetical protein